MVEKKNPDYSASAVNLTNSDQINEQFELMQNQQSKLNEINKKIEDSIPEELKQSRHEIEERITDTVQGIRKLIDEHGSYQDIEKGWYAIKQRRESITYQPILVRRLLPDNVASLVLVESVDTKKLDGLIKGGIVTQEQAKACGEVKETFAYIIR